MVVKFACCVGLEADGQLERLGELGYDGFETSLSAVSAAGSEAASGLAARAAAIGLECVSCNGMFPAELRLLGGRGEYARVGDYLERAFEAAAPLRVPVVALGSGGARSIPEGMSIELARERFCEMLCDVVAPAAARNGIVVAIEPLRAEECNFLNSCREVVEIVRAVNLPEIRLLVDWYHAALGGDTLGEIAGYGAELAHVHLASPTNGRLMPIAREQAEWDAVFAALAAAGYDGAVSLEGGDGGDFVRAAAEAIGVMRRARSGSAQA